MAVKGTRLPEDWELPEDWRSWAKAERPDLDLDQVAAEFRDYWISRTGQGATKLNWQATWRNWIRRQNGRKPTQSAPRPSSHKRVVVQRMDAERWQEKRKKGISEIQKLREKMRW